MSSAAAKTAGKTAAEPEKKPRRRIKKVAGHGGHHGGSWKVAYADFVTAMMALFLVLWLLSQADTKVKQAIANYFRSPGVFSTQKGGILGGPKKVSREPSELTTKEEEQALAGVATALKKQFLTRPEISSYKDQVKVEVTDEGLRIQIVDKADRVSFESGNAGLNPTARAVLAEIARSICALPNLIAIGGHTDRHLFPEGSTYTNWELSADRANAARRALESNCVKPEQIRRVIGYADTELLLPDDPFAPTNRRITIIVLRLNPVSNTGQHKKPEKEESSSSTDKPVDESPPAEKSAGTEKAEPRSEAAATEAPLKKTKAREQKPVSEKRPASGAISVGTPDKVPAKATRVREKASSPDQ